MIIIITLFYFSLATVIFMVLWKLVSIRKLKFSLIDGIEKEFHGKFYDVVHKLWYFFIIPYIVKVRTFLVAVFFIIAHEGLRIVEVWGQKLKVRHSKLFDMVKGRGVIKKKGSASFFIRDVIDFKKQLSEKKDN